MGVLIFKGMSVGILEGDLSIGCDDDGEFQGEVVLSTSYDVLPIWLRIAHENVEHAKIAFEAIADRWDEDPDNQRKLLLAELTAAVQTFVACGVAYDAFYEQIRPFAGISEMDAAAWKRKRTSRAAQVSEVIRRVYKLNDEDFTAMKKAIEEIIKLRDVAVHPSLELKRTMTRPDLAVDVDWRFCAYCYENALKCYQNTMKTFIHLREKTSPHKRVNERMNIICEALEEMGLIISTSAH